MKSSLILLGLLGCAFAVQKVPLRKITSMREKMTKAGTWAEYQQKRQTARAAARAHGEIPENDYSDLVYIADVQVGTPPQTFQVVADTGSSNFWIPDKTCRGTPCANKHKFDKSASSTYGRDGRPFAIQYGTGSCQGTLGVDTVSFGGIVAEQTTFGQATVLASFFADQPLDGILGMGWPQIAVDGVTPVVHQMIQNNELDEARFGVWMTEETGGDGTIAGEITLGGIDTTKFTGDITYTRVTRKGYWQFNINGAKVNGQNVARSGSAISDTGTSLIVGPTSTVRSIASALGGRFNPQQGLYTVDCSKVDSLPDVVFTIENKDFAVTSKSYVLRLDGLCLLGFESLSGAPIDWILGDVFIRDWYQIYDIGGSQIGFARSV
jgi:hypothetical protein